MLNRLTCFAIAQLLCAAVTAQIITVHETDIDGKQYPVGDYKLKNVDINSTISLRLDTAALIKKIGDSGVAGLPAETKELIAILTEAINRKDLVLRRFAKAIDLLRADAGSTVTTEKKKQFVRETQEIAAGITTLFDKDPVLEAYFAEETDQRLIAPLYPALQRRIREIETSVLQSPAYSDMKLRLGGWIIHKGVATPIHFEGLDTNPVGEFYEVERWRFLPTPDQLAELERLQALARESKLGEVNFGEIVIDTIVQGLRDAIADKLSEEATSFKAKAEEIVTQLADGEIKKQLTIILEESKKLSALLSAKLAWYGGAAIKKDFSLAKFLSTAIADLTAINESQKTIVTNLQKLKTSINVASADIKRTCSELVSYVDGRIVKLTSSLFNTDFLTGLGGNLPELVLAFTDKILFLSLKDLPAEISTDLRNTGFREEGDRVLLKLELSKGEENKVILTEPKTITLYSIAAHLQGTVGVIFAHPLKSTAIQKDFQMAPYYNVLFKGIFGASQKWKRTSALPNTLLDMNWGLHISSPDFDKDDVPELGIGIVVSSLHDYLQAGCAYNLFQGVPYFFIGIRLPVPSMNFGGNGQSSTPVAQ